MKGESIYPRIGYEIITKYGKPVLELRTAVRIERSGIWYRVDVLRSAPMRYDPDDIIELYQGLLIDVNDVVYLYSPGLKDRDEDQRSEKQRLIQELYGYHVAYTDSWLRIWGALEDQKLRHEKLIRELYGGVKSERVGYIKPDSFEDELGHQIQQGKISLSQAFMTLMKYKGVDTDSLIKAAQVENDFEPFKIRTATGNVSNNDYIINKVLGDRRTEWHDNLLFDCKYMFYHGDGVLKGSNDDSVFEESDLNELTIEDL